ncbi:type 1 fimbrial protein [Pseudomonas sp. Irchel s3f7]|jgi:type 1 fimbria pilin|uniref:type 1 fimbrial protein n=1 Tax=Pseudomonas sp. Irchel s3f7 TaxID=2009153 RepID=UPI000BA4AE01|nr:type 1 fimbrial protein [Pseudomonas sp. Irchel s3f7]
MNSKHLAVGFSLLFALNGACLAASSTISFQGSIVESGCQPNMGTAATFELYGCPVQSRTMAFSAKSITPTVGVSSLNPTGVKVKLLDEKERKSRYFDQQYALVDDTGAPVQSGNYLITLSMP